MKVSRAGMLAAAGFLIMAAAGIADVLFEGLGWSLGDRVVMGWVGLVIGGRFLWEALSIKQREDAARVIAPPPGTIDAVPCLKSIRGWFQHAADYNGMSKDVCANGAQQVDQMISQFERQDANGKASSSR